MPRFFVLVFLLGLLAVDLPSAPNRHDDEPSDPALKVARTDVALFS
jgi:hypothetical protein